MKRMTIPVLLLAWTLGLAVMTGQALLPTSSAAAPATKVRQPWEYASLIVGNLAVDVHWETGKASLSSPGDVKKPDLDRSVNEVYKQMGGKEQSPTLFVLLNLIGLDGWELVSYAHSDGAQVWMFKRVAP